MPNSINVRFPYDPTGVNPDNLIQGEIHSLTSHAVRAVAPTYGPFFTASLQVYDNTTDQILIKGTDYEVVEMLEDITLRLGKEVCNLILILNQSVSASVRITYQVVGGLYQNSAAALINMYETVLQDNRPVAWENVLGKPLLFPPTTHLHNLVDVYGFEPLVGALERVRNAIILSNIPAFEALIDWILAHLNDCCAGEVDARVAGDNALSDAIQQEILNRVLGDNNLASLLQNEILARIASDNELRSLIASGGGGGQPYANTPVITAPVNESLSIPLTQVFTCTMESSGITVGAYFQWQIANNIGFLSSGTTGDGKGGTFTNAIIAQTSNGQMNYAPSGLTNDTDLYIRVRYVHPSPAITTAWSSVIHCRTVAVDAPGQSVQILSIPDNNQQPFNNNKIATSLSGNYIALGGHTVSTFSGRNVNTIQMLKQALTTNVANGEVAGLYSNISNNQFMSTINLETNLGLIETVIKDFKIKLSKDGRILFIFYIEEYFSNNVFYRTFNLRLYNSPTSNTYWVGLVDNYDVILQTGIGFYTDSVYTNIANINKNVVFSDITNYEFYYACSEIDSEVRIGFKNCIGYSDQLASTNGDVTFPYPNLARVPTNSGFGIKLGINDIGDRVVVAAPRDNHNTLVSGIPSGAVYVYVRANHNTWSLEQKIIPATPAANDNFGDSIEINHAGTEIFITKYPAGSVPIIQTFKKNGSNVWTKIQDIYFDDFVDCTNVTGALSVYFSDEKFKNVEFKFSADDMKVLINFNTLHREVYEFAYQAGSWQLTKTITLPLITGHPTPEYPVSMEVGANNDFSTVIPYCGFETATGYPYYNQAYVFK